MGCEDNLDSQDPLEGAVFTFSEEASGQVVLWLRKGGLEYEAD